MFSKRYSIRIFVVSFFIVCCLPSFAQSNSNKVTGARLFSSPAFYLSSVLSLGGVYALYKIGVWDSFYNRFHYVLDSVKKYLKKQQQPEIHTLRSHCVTVTEEKRGLLSSNASSSVENFLRKEDEFKLDNEEVLIREALGLKEGDAFEQASIQEDRVTIKNPEYIRELLVDRPGDLLELIHRKYPSYCDELVIAPRCFDHIFPSIKKANNFVIERLQEFPLFLFDECDCPPLRRQTTDSGSINPDVRSYFEKLVVEDVEKQIGEKNASKLLYASIGSGYMYQDLVLITKILSKNQTIKNVRLFLQDNLYYTEIDNPYSMAEYDKKIWLRKKEDSFFNNVCFAFEDILKKMFPSVDFKFDYSFSSLVVRSSSLLCEQILKEDDEIALFVGVDLNLDQSLLPVNVTFLKRDKFSVEKKEFIGLKDIYPVLFPEILFLEAELVKNSNFVLMRNALLSDFSIWFMDKMKNENAAQDWRIEIWHRAPSNPMQFTNIKDIPLTLLQETLKPSFIS